MIILSNRVIQKLADGFERPNSTGLATPLACHPHSRKDSMRFVTSIALLAISSFNLALAQTPPASTAASARDQTKPENTPSASPDEDVRKKWVGTWDATIESTGKDGKPVTNPAKATVKLAYGGKWLVTEFEGTFMGKAFSGQEVLGYDARTKKYFLNWIDSAATTFSTGEGTFDPKTDTMTFAVNGLDDSTGKMATWRQVDVWKDADHHEWSIRTTKDGKEQIQMTIRYRRHP